MQHARRTEVTLALAVPAAATILALALTGGVGRDRVIVIVSLGAMAALMLATDVMLPIGRSKIGMALDAARRLRGR